MEIDYELFTRGGEAVRTTSLTEDITH